MSLASSLQSLGTYFQYRDYRLSQDVPLAAGGPVLLLGSAPTASVPADFGHDWTLVCANAAQAGGDRLGLASPQLIVLRTNFFDAGRVHAEAREALRNRSATHVVFRGVPEQKAYVADQLADLAFTYETLTVVERQKRERIVLQAVGNVPALIAVNRDLSNGVFSLCCCIDLFRQPVVMSGFSFSVAGHAYNASNLPRAHVDQDRKALRIIQSRGWPVYASEAKFAEESGLPLWKGSPS